MEYVSVAQSRAGFHPGGEADSPKKKAAKPRKRPAKKATTRAAIPQTSVEPAANTNPDGVVPVSQSEEG